MDENTVIQAEGVCKKFCRSLKRSMAYGSIDLAKSFIGKERSSRLRKGEFWALEDINFELKKGEALGVIGLNGSGKSTLLRVLTGIYPPDRGTIKIRGSVGSLIAVGAGFHPHMSGRENIYLNGTILGMKRKEIDQKFQSIVDFADIGGFLDAPVSTYSSGMRVRLGFAVAIHCEPDILLVDEILSVGDMSFRNKSLRYMAEYRKKANALIFISHDIEQVRNLCDRVMILDAGKIIYDGETFEGLARYEELTRSSRTISLTTEGEQTNADTNMDVEYRGIGLLDEYNNSTNQMYTDAELILYCDFLVRRKVEGLYFSISIHSDKLENKNCIWVMSNDDSRNEFSNLVPGDYRLTLRIKEHHLAPGVYMPTVAIRNSLTMETYERVFTRFSFIINSRKSVLERGIVNVDEKWSLSRI